MTLRARTVEIDDPGDLLAHLPDADGLVWLLRGEGFVAWGRAAAVPVGTGSRRLPAAERHLAALFADAAVDDEVGVPGSGLLAMGSVTFDPDAPGSVLVVPRVVVGRRDGRAWLTTVSGDGSPPPPAALGRVQALPAPARIRYAGSSVAELRWLEAVDAAVRSIRAGELEKVVLARDLAVWSQEPLDGRSLVRRLADRFPGCFTFACAGLLGASPELLVRRRGAVVESLVLAGSAARGQDAASDERLGAGLLSSDKERAEHRPAVASVRDALVPLTDHLDVDDAPRLLRLDNVQHLATSVRGRLVRPLTALALAGRLHPTAAVCGSPTDVALERIRALEGLQRGRYSGPVGWVDAAGDGEWAIALRCATIAGSRARLYAGAGIVADSLPEAELEETRIKLLAMQSAFAREPLASTGA